MYIHMNNKKITFLTLLKCFHCEYLLLYIICYFNRYLVILKNIFFLLTLKYRKLQEFFKNMGFFAEIQEFKAQTPKYRNLQEFIGNWAPCIFTTGKLIVDKLQKGYICLYFILANTIILQLTNDMKCGLHYLSCLGPLNIDTGTMTTQLR